MIPLLSVTAVLRNDADGNRHQFFVRYVTRGGPRDLYLERIDRDRDVWVDGLYEFVQMVRDQYERQKARASLPPEPEPELSEEVEEEFAADKKQADTGSKKQLAGMYE